jgi:hypothetical protein
MGLFKKREPEPYKEPEPVDKPTAGTPEPIYTIKPSVGTTTQKFFTYADIPGAIPKQKPEQDWIAIDTLKLSERIEKLEQQVKQLSEQVEKPQFYIEWMESVIEEHVDEYHTEPVATMTSPTCEKYNHETLRQDQIHPDAKAVREHEARFRVLQLKAMAGSKARAPNERAVM